jgi:hypothetical protein
MKLLEKHTFITSPAFLFNNDNNLFLNTTKLHKTNFLFLLYEIYLAIVKKNQQALKKSY